MLGPHTHTPAPTAQGWRTPTARPVGGQSGEGQRLTSDAPHNGGMHSPTGKPIRHPHSEQRRPARAHAVGLVLGPHASTDRTQDTLVAEPWLPAPEDERPGEGQRLTPDAPHKGGRPPPPGTAPHRRPGHAAPTGHAGQGDSVGPPHPHTRAHSTWVADPNSPPSGWAVRGGTATDLRRFSQWWAAAPRGRSPIPPKASNAGPQGRKLWGWCWVPKPASTASGTHGSQKPWLPAPEDGRPEEGQHLTPEAPHNGGGPPPPGTAPGHPRGTQPPQGMQAKGTMLGPHTHTHTPTARGWRTPKARPVGGQSGQGQRLTSDAPHNGGRQPPRDTPPPPPQRATPARKGARCGAGAGSPRPHRPRPGHTGRGTLAARSRGRAARKGTVPDTRRPSQRWQATPPGDGPPPPPRHAAPKGHARQGDSVEPPHPHTRAHSMWVADPNSPPSGRAVGGGTAPDLRRPSHNGGKHPPRGRPSASPKASNAGLQGRMLWGCCWVPTATLTAPGTHRSRYPRCPPQRAGGRGRDSATRRPSQQWQANPPGDGPPQPPRHAAPTGHAGQGQSVGPPTHTPPPTARG